MHIFQKVAMGSAERYMGAKYYIQFISRQEAESPEKKKSDQVIFLFEEVKQSWIFMDHFSSYSDDLRSRGS